MLEAYHKLYETYLRICRKMGTMKERELRESIATCEHFKWKLHGMNDLLMEAGIITEEQECLENERILRDFSTIRLYDAYETDGELMVFVKSVEREAMPEDPFEF